MVKKRRQNAAVLTALIMLRDLDAGLAMATVCAGHRLVMTHHGPSAAIHDAPLPGPKPRGKRRRGRPQPPEQRPPGPRRQQPTRLALIDLGADPALTMAAVVTAYDMRQLQLIGCQSDTDHATWAGLLDHHCDQHGIDQQVICAPTQTLQEALAACDLGPSLPQRAPPIGDRPRLIIDLSPPPGPAPHCHLLPTTKAYRHAQDIGAAAASSISAGSTTTIAPTTALPPDGRHRTRALQALATAAIRTLQQGRPDHICLRSGQPSDSAALLRALLHAHRQPTWRASGRCDDGTLWGRLHNNDAPVLIMPSTSVSKRIKHTAELR